jgi:hypothetical protein
VQERGGANDGEGWNCIDEGRLKERRQEEDRKWWWGDSWGGPDELIEHVDERHIERCRGLFLQNLAGC